MDRSPSKMLFVALLVVTFIMLLVVSCLQAAWGHANTLSDKNQTVYILSYIDIFLLVATSIAGFIVVS